MEVALISGKERREQDREQGREGKREEGEEKEREKKSNYTHIMQMCTLVSLLLLSQMTISLLTQDVIDPLMSDSISSIQRNNHSTMTCVCVCVCVCAWSHLLSPIRSFLGERFDLLVGRTSSTPTVHTYVHIKHVSILCIRNQKNTQNVQLK